LKTEAEMDLFAAFLALPEAESTSNLTAVALSKQRHDFLAKTNDGSPVFLLHDASLAAYSPAIELKNVSVIFHSTCRVTTLGGSLDGQFAVITCGTSVPELYEVFIRCFSASVEQLPVASTTEDLQRCIHNLLELFCSLGSVSAQETIGLWAELYLISRCSNPAQAVRAWHKDSFERFDFSWPDGCLEVKATTKEQRVHEFALEQLHPPISGDGFVASVLLQPMNGGVGVIDLANVIERRLATMPELRQKLWENVTSALGSDFSSRLDRRFDPSYADRGLTIYAMSDIPAPEHPKDPRVTGIHFRADLSAVQTSLAGGLGDLLDSLFG